MGSARKRPRKGRPARKRPAPSRAGKKKAARRRNPPIAVLGNPGGAPVPIGKRVDAVLYEHVTEGARVHEFGPGVRVEGLADGSIRIYHPRKRLWADL